MNKVFEREVSQLKEAILRQAGDVEMRLARTLDGVGKRDTAVLATVVKQDHEIDVREVLIEEDCLKILALHQPVAKDLRFVIAVLKINNDLERVGDIVAHLAKRGTKIMEYPELPMMNAILDIGHLAGSLLKKSIDALVTLDIALAKAVIVEDSEVDTMYKETIRAIKKIMASRDTAVEPEALILARSMAYDMERIGDHSTNIAEDVVYLVDGSIIRHQ